MTTVPNILYKYVPPERSDILKNLNIRFTQPSALNDPFEFNLPLEKLVSSTQMLDHISNVGTEHIYKNALASMTADQKAIMNLLSSSQLKTLKKQLIEKFLTIENIELINNTHINPNTPKVISEIYSQLDKSIGILSLTPNCTSPSMWANYADNSKGFAIGFNTRDPFFNRRRSNTDELYHLRKVIYEDSKLANSILEMDHNLLIQKNKCWDYEQEWRMLLPLSTANSEFMLTDDNKVSLFDYPPSALSHIVFGMSASKSTIESIINSIEKIEPNVNIEFSQIIKGTTSLAISPI